MPDSFLIWGGGGHGRVVADLIRALGYTVAGYVDRDAGKLHCVVEPGGARVMFTDDVLLAQLSSAVMQGTDPRTQQTHGDAFALAIGDNAARHACFERLAGFDVPSLIHPSAICSPSARVGRGTVVFPAAVINAGAQIGDVAIVNFGRHHRARLCARRRGARVTRCDAWRYGARWRAELDWGWRYDHSWDHCWCGRDGWRWCSHHS